MTDDQKREIVERVARKCGGDGVDKSVNAVVSAILHAINHFKLREAAEKALKELRAYRSMTGADVDGPVERELEAALKGRRGESTTSD